MTAAVTFARPVALRRARVPGGGEELQEGLVEGGRPGVLLGLEVLVEGLAREASAGGQLARRGDLEALLGREREHRFEDPLALVAVHEGGRQAVAAVGQPL